jgi:hypothetical protein
LSDDPVSISIQPILDRLDGADHRSAVEDGGVGDISAIDALPSRRIHDLRLGSEFLSHGGMGVFARNQSGQGDLSVRVDLVASGFGSDGVSSHSVGPGVDRLASGSLDVTLCSGYRRPSRHPSTRDLLKSTPWSLSPAIVAGIKGRLPSRRVRGRSLYSIPSSSSEYESECPRFCRCEEDELELNGCRCDFDLRFCLSGDKSESAKSKSLLDHQPRSVRFCFLLRGDLF